GEGWPAPERERLAEGRGCRGGLARRALRPTAVEQPLEPLGVEFARLDVQAVAGPLGDDPFLAESLPEAVHLHLEGVGRGRRWALAPECLDQQVAADDLVCA